jgi:hypothetical protein
MSLSIFGFHKPKPSITVFLSIRMYTDTRLMAIKILPSAGTNELIRITSVLASLVKNYILDFSDRKASATIQSDSSNTTVFFQQTIKSSLMIGILVFPFYPHLL